jgi:prevent-host-death family protein
VDTVPVRELRNHTSAVLRRVQSGDEVTITHNGVPVATLTAVKETRQRPMPKSELSRLLDRLPYDPGFAADIDRLAEDTTDDLGPIA